MNLTAVGIFGAMTTLLGTIGGFVVALRRSSSDSEDHWQELVRAQLATQIDRNSALDARVNDLWSALDIERVERRRIEASMGARIALLEQTLRSNGITVP